MHAKVIAGSGIFGIGADTLGVYVLGGPSSP